MRRRFPQRINERTVSRYKERTPLDGVLGADDGTRTRNDRLGGLVPHQLDDIRIYDKMDSVELN